MELHQIVVATDESETGRHAVRVAAGLAVESRARLCIMTTLPALKQAGAPLPVPVDGLATAGPEVQHLAQWLGSDLAPASAAVRVDLAVTIGLPGVEIARFAEEHRADLLVVGRNSRSQTHRLLSGDTADAVARRSRVACLFVPVGHDSFKRVLAAVDGSQRGHGVLTVATDFSRAVNGSLRAVTVEPDRADEPGTLASSLPSGRSTRLAQTMERLRITDEGACAPWDSEWGQGEPMLQIRRGDPVAEILAEVAASAADVLAIGYHRGGPPGVLEAGSVARRLAHAAPCALLTVPL